MGDENELSYKNGDWYHPHYDKFSVGSASEGYPLGCIGGDDTDWFADHSLNRIKFSTPGTDNDRSSGNCAAKWKTGWWYKNCTNIKPPYIGNKDVVFIEMMIGPKDVCNPN